jgi:glycosyltransferase involved in cell wall biosynthesis
LRVTVLASKCFDLIEESKDLHVERIEFPVHNPILRVFWEVFILPFYLRKSHVDVFFCPGGTIPKFGFGPWKTVTMFRNMIPFDMKQRKRWPIGYMRVRNWILERIMLKSMERADLVIFISEYAKQVIHSISFQGIKNDVVIPHGVSDDFKSIANNALTQPSILPDEAYIVYPSIIDVYKSQIEVVQAYALAVKSMQSAPLLLLVGEVYGQYGANVIDTIKQLGMNDRIHVIGAVNYQDMPMIYHNAEFVVFASQSENCPNILLEAMKSSSAILCSNIMPMPEFAGSSVEYIDPTSVENIAEKIHELLSDSQKINSLRRMSSERAKHYRWETTSSKTWKAIANV